MGQIKENEMKKIDNIMKKIKDWFTISILLSGIILCLSVSYSLLITTEKLSRKLLYWEENDRPTAPLRYENVKYGQQTAVFDKITGDYYVRDFFTADSVIFLPLPAGLSGAVTTPTIV